MHNKTKTNTENQAVIQTEQIPSYLWVCKFLICSQDVGWHKSNHSNHPKDLKSAIFWHPDGMVQIVTFRKGPMDWYR